MGTGLISEMEDERLASLRSLNILDTPAEERLRPRRNDLIE